MTRNSILFSTSTAILVAMGHPQFSLSAPAVDGIRLAQAAAPPADDKDKDKRPPGQRPAQGAPAPGTPGQRPAQGTPPPGAPGQQHPPAANAPPGRQAPATAQPAPQQQQRPGTPPPAAAQTLALFAGELKMSLPEAEEPDDSEDEPPAGASTSGNASDNIAHRGLAPIAARSDRFTASALWPSACGSTSGKKCTPSTSMSVEAASSHPGLTVSNAASSPIASVVCRGARVKYRAIRSNSDNVVARPGLSICEV